MAHINRFLQRCFVVFIALPWCSMTCQDANAQERPFALVQPPESAAESVSVEIVQSLRDDNPQQALELLAGLIDSGITARDLVYSSLPSAAAAINRSLTQLDVQERYELLESWSLPGDGEPSVRLLATPVPSEAPPKVFARAIGERPRDTTFAVAGVGKVNGCFNSGWMLVQAANELGRLPRLRARLDDLQNVDGAKPLRMLAQLAGSRGDLELVRDYLNSTGPGGSVNQNALAELIPLDLVNASIAMAALEHEELHESSESALENLVQRGSLGSGVSLRPFLRIAHAVAVQVHRGSSPVETLFDHRLKHWIPISVRSAKDISRGQPRGVWLTHEDHVLHLAGGETDVLMCRFPLQGEFDFICETQSGGDIGTDGGLVYGGLHFQAIGRQDKLQVWDADGIHSTSRYSPFARFEKGPVFNRVSIRSSTEKSQFESNFHPVWFDSVGKDSSPWIGLRSSGTKRPVFRNVRIEGNPTIPESVSLLGQTELRGWTTGFFGESQAGFKSEQNAAAKGPSNEAGKQSTGSTEIDWEIKSGELSGNVAKDDDQRERPSLIRFQRPVTPGDSVEYEFWMAEDGSAKLHPAFGRLAFLLEPTGIRVRWITTGPTEWTGLESDNTALEPRCRRGPRPLPVKQNAWNQVRLEYTDGNLLVSINDTLVYQRPNDHESEGQFGLYRPDRQNQVRIRNVIMTGDWPNTLPDEFIKSPLTLASSSQ